MTGRRFPPPVTEIHTSARQEKCNVPGHSRLRTRFPPPVTGVGDSHLSHRTRTRRNKTMQTRCNFPASCHGDSHLSQPHPHPGRNQCRQCVSASCHGDSHFQPFYWLPRVDGTAAMSFRLLSRRFTPQPPQSTRTRLIAAASAFPPPVTEIHTSASCSMTLTPTWQRKQFPPPVTEIHTSAPGYEHTWIDLLPSGLFPPPVTEIHTSASALCRLSSSEGRQLFPPPVTEIHTSAGRNSVARSSERTQFPPPVTEIHTSAILQTLPQIGRTGH